MKLKQYIHNSIRKYPSLYKDTTYEKSRIKVLDHVFFCIGNGLEFAHTKDKSKGGYIIEPSYYRKNGDWVRKQDKVYNAGYNFTPLTEEYFKTEITKEWSESQKEFWEGIDKILPARVCKSTYIFKPSDICEYSMAWEHLVDGNFLQPDWIEGLKDLMQESLSFYLNEDRYKNHHKFPTDSSIKSTLNAFDNKTFKEMLNLRSIWGYAKSRTFPTYSEVRSRKELDWNIFKDRQIKFLKKHLNPQPHLAESMSVFYNAQIINK